MQVGMATVGYQLKRAQQALRAAMDEALRPQGLTTPQYAVLTALEAEAGLSGAELARRCFVTPQTMNEIVAGLEARGWVTRRRHAEHGRVLQTFLTDQGAAAGMRAVQLNIVNARTGSTLPVGVMVDVQ